MGIWLGIPTFPVEISPLWPRYYTWRMYCSYRSYHQSIRVIQWNHPGTCRGTGSGNRSRGWLHIWPGPHAPRSTGIIRCRYLWLCCLPGPGPCILRWTIHLLLSRDTQPDDSTVSGQLLSFLSFHSPSVVDTRINRGSLVGGRCSEHEASRRVRRAGCEPFVEIF